MINDGINQRTQQVLKNLVERYIQDGCPIASKTLAEECALGLSSATIRHILADLEAAGYLTSLHTSSGRVPTVMGYRFFVDGLLEVKPLGSVDNIAALKEKFDPDLTVSHLLQSASTLLSDLTQLAGIVALPRRNRIELRQVEFLSLSENRVLVILVLNNREVQNRIMHTDRIYSSSDLQQAANFLNTHFAGKDLLTIRKELFAAIRCDQEKLASFLKIVMNVFDKPAENKDYIIAGQNYLLNDSNQEANLERLRLLFDAFNEKQEILNLLDSVLEADGIQIFIGKESGYEAFDDCSIVAASYSIDGQLVGSLGVIGSTRMPYDKAISAVDVTAKLLSAALSQS
jgi:heat-inducible transcriptional repressor